MRALVAAFVGPLAAGMATMGADVRFLYPSLIGSLGRAVMLADLCATFAQCAFVASALLPFILLYRGGVEWTEVSLERGRFEGREVTGFSVAPDGTAFSVAVGTKSAGGATTTFLEVDTLDDARRIASAIGARFPLDGSLQLTLAKRSLLLALGMFAFVDVALASLVRLFAERHATGAFAICGTMLAILLAFLVREGMRDAMRVSWGTTTRIQASRALEPTPIERHVRRHREAMLTEDPAPPRVRVELLSRGNAPLRAWLARLDGLERVGSYRGEHTPREVLYETVNDTVADIDVRLGAARLLRVRDGEDSAHILEGIGDADVRDRMSAITIDDASEAAAALEEIGPLFRNR